MKSNKFMKVTAAVMTAAMLAAAIPVSAAAEEGIHTAVPSATPTVVQEVYGDSSGLYWDAGYTYSDGSYVMQTLMPASRSMNKWPFAFFLYYNSGAATNNRLGNGISSTYDQKLIRNGTSDFTYIDDKGISHEIWYDERTGSAFSSEGPVELFVDAYRYQLKFGDNYEMWFDREDGDLTVYYTNTDVDGATRIYRDEDGSIQEVLCKDYSHYRFGYETLADGSKRVSMIEYAESTGGANRQIVTFSYDADGNLIDTVNTTDQYFERGYTYTYHEGRLASVYNKMMGGTLRVVSDPAGKPVIQYQAR